MFKFSERTKVVLAIALPITVQNLVMHLQLVIDRAFLGKLDERYLAAIGNVMIPYNAATMFLFSAATGLTILVAQKLGSGQKQKAGEYAEASFVYSSVFSSLIFFLWFFFADAIFSFLGADGQIKHDAVRFVKMLSFSLIFFGIDVTAVSILQGIGYTKPIMYGGILRTAVTIFLDWCLIFGNFGFPRMGLEGAAIATIAGNFVGMCVVLFAALKWKNLPFRYTASAILKPSWKEYRETLRLGLPTGFESLLWFAGQLVLVKMQNMLDPMAIGITSVVGSLQLLAVFAYMGFARAAVTLVGKKWGEGNHEELVKTGLYCQKLAFIVSLVWGAVMFFFGRELSHLFTDTASLVDRSAEILKLAAFFINVQVFNVVIGGAIRGTGDTRWMMYSQIVGTVFVIAVSYLTIFKLGMGLAGMYITMIADEGLRGFVNVMRFIKGRNPIPGFASKLKSLPDSIYSIIFTRGGD